MYILIQYSSGQFFLEKVFLYDISLLKYTSDGNQAKQGFFIVFPAYVKISTIR